MTSATIIALFAVAFVGLIAFVFIELKKKSPLAQLRLFRNRTFAAGNIVALVIMFGLLGVIFLVVLFLQLLGFSAIKAGVTILPLPVMIMVVAPFAGRLTDKIGGRWLLFAGTLISAGGIYLMSNLTASTTETSLILPLALCGVGMGMIMAPVTTVVMASTPVPGVRYGGWYPFHHPSGGFCDGYLAGCHIAESAGRECAKCSGSNSSNSGVNP